MNDDASSVQTATDFAGSLAAHVPHHNRYLMARAWLLLPVLWAARTGHLDTSWRLGLPTQIGDGPWDDRAYDIRAAAIELANLPPQPWEIGGPDALEAWFDAALEQAHAVYAHWALMSATQLIDPQHPWSIAAWQACHATCVLTEASYLAAGPHSPRSTCLMTERTVSAPEPPVELPPADAALVFAAPPPHWRAEHPGLDPRVAAAITERFRQSGETAAAARLLCW